TLFRSWRLRLRRSWRPGERVTARIHAYETEYDGRGNQQGDRSPSASLHRLVLASAARLLAKIFGPSQSENGDRGSDKQPMITTDHSCARAEPDRNQQQRPDTTDR